MRLINIQIPEDVVLAARIPHKRLKEEIKREVCPSLQRRHPVPWASKKVSRNGKSGFSLLLGAKEG